MSNKIQELKFGDIICVKSFNFIGWAIGNSFHVDSPMMWYKGSNSVKKRPSNHNGVLGYDDDGELCVFEALSDGIVKTKISDYLKDVKDGKFDIPGGLVYIE